MTDPRYPIGGFELPASVSPGRREAWTQDIAELPALLRSAVEGREDEDLDLRSREGAWTVRQLIHHLADTHAHGASAFRAALAEKDPPLLALPEKLLSRFPDASDGDVEPSLRLLEGLHLRWASLLHNMKDADYARPMRWAKAPFSTLEGALGYYAWHGRHHATQIEIALFRRHGAAQPAWAAVSTPQGW